MLSPPAAPAVRALSPMVSLDYWRFLVFGRVLPMVLFGFLGVRQWQSVLGSVANLPDNAGVGDILRGPAPGFLYLLFCALPVGIYLVRPRPTARDGRLVARIAAFAGTLMLVGVNAFPSPVLVNEPAWLLDMVTPLLVAAYALAVWGLVYLRKSFSIIPEARRVVQGGPYAVIRHPLYAAEITAALAAVVARPALLPVLALPVFVAVQLLRSVYEERLLRNNFPAYHEYAASTWRILPFLF